MTALDPTFQSLVADWATAQNFRRLPEIRADAAPATRSDAVPATGAGAPPALADAFQAAVRARAELVVSAARVLADAPLEAMSDREIHEAVLRKTYGKEFDPTGKSDAYLSGAFAHALRSSVPMPSATSGGEHASAPSESARADSHRSYTPPWRRPLSVSRDRQSERTDNESPPWQRPLRISKQQPGASDLSQWQRALSYSADYEIVRRY